MIYEEEVLIGSHSSLIVGEESEREQSHHIAQQTLRYNTIDTLS